MCRRSVYPPSPKQWRRTAVVGSSQKSRLDLGGELLGTAGYRGKRGREPSLIGPPRRRPAREGRSAAFEASLTRAEPPGAVPARSCRASLSPHVCVIIVAPLPAILIADPDEDFILVRIGLLTNADRYHSVDETFSSKVPVYLRITRSHAEGGYCCQHRNALPSADK